MGSEEWMKLFCIFFSKMNEIVEACKTIYNLKSVLDRDYSQRNVLHGPTDLKCIKHTTNRPNLLWNATIHLVYEV